MIFPLLLVIFGYNSDQCNTCSWPYVGTSNQRGECVLGLGLQSNVENGCAIYCQDWGNRVAGQTVSNHVISSDPQGTCICQRLSADKFTEYISRPRKICDSWGASDDYINSQKTFSLTSPNTSFNPYYASSSDMSSNYGINVGGMKIFDATHNFSMSGSMDFSGPMNSINNNFASIQNSIVYSVSSSIASLRYFVDTSQVTMKNRIRSLDSSLVYTSAKLSGLPNSSDLQSSFDRLNYSINSHSGGGDASTPVDLSPVLSAIRSAKAANDSSFAQLGSLIQSSASDQSAKLSVLSSSVSALGDSVASVGKSVEGVSATLSSIDSLRRHDEKKTSDAMQRYNDSVASAGSAGYSSGDVSALSAGGGSFAVGLVGWRDATCSDTPPLKIPFFGHTIDLTPMVDGMAGTLAKVIRAIFMAAGLLSGALFAFRTITTWGMN